MHTHCGTGVNTEIVWLLCKTNVKPESEPFVTEKRFI